MLLELVLVGAVLALVGMALYQSSQRTKTAATEATTPVPATTEGLATSAVKVVEQESSTDTALSADAEASADELSQSDSDVTNLGSASNASF
jgi:hypothetical protein